MLSERLAGWRHKFPDVKVRHELVQDRPSRALLDFGSTARLMVIGRHGHGGFAGMLLGSTTRAMIVHNGEQLSGFTVPAQ